MGKLHKIRRAIARNPQAWIEQSRLYDRKSRAMGAMGGVYRSRYTGKIVRNPWQSNNYDLSSPARYRQFVRKTLRDLGFDVD